MSKSAENSQTSFDTDAKQRAETISKLYMKLSEKLYAHLNKAQDLSSLKPMAANVRAMQSALLNVFHAWAANPETIFDKNIEYWQNYSKIWQNFAARVTGQDVDVEDVAAAPKGDRRFMDERWSDNPFFDAIKQSFLLTRNLTEDLIESAEGVDQKEKERAQFAAGMLIDTFSPSNIWFLNPQVLDETLESGGENFIRGLENLIADLDKETPSISMVGEGAFEVGKNLAVTPGAVVYENEMVQIIQYEAVTDKVYKRPLFIVSPWINKYYILDLRAENSMVKWLTEQGYTVFITSWANPGSEQRDFAFEDYMDKGILETSEFIKKHTGEDEINIVGYCIGGTALSAALSYAQSKKIKFAKSATFFTTLISFADAGEMEVFIDEDQLNTLDEFMNRTGVLEGHNMHSTFNMLRANDLIWSFVINNYMRGKEPFPFDLLYWNSDSVNLPATMHSYYLRNMYLLNNLIKPNGLTMKGEPIDLSKIKVPNYFISTKDDHIAPWKTTYEGAQAMSKDDCTFTLAASGHIAGVVNHPDKNKRHYWTKSDGLERTPEAWFDKAKKQEGSWWPHWEKWLRKHSGKKISARKIKKKDRIEDAPGLYVKMAPGEYPKR